MAARKKISTKKTSRSNYRNLRILLVLVLISLGLFYFFWYLPSTKPHPTDLPTKFAAPSTSTQFKEVRSSDGTMTLKAKLEKLPQGGSVYSFYALTNASQTEQPLFSKTIDADSAITLPGNSWSPDNKSAFIQESGPNNLTFLVFKASGETYAGGEKYYDIGALFKLKQPKYILTDATGWASETLVIIKTKIAETGEKGPSFWFDLTSQSFLMLSR